MCRAEKKYHCLVSANLKYLAFKGTLLNPINLSQLQPKKILDIYVFHNPNSRNIVKTTKCVILALTHIIKFAISTYRKQEILRP